MALDSCRFDTLLSQDIGHRCITILLWKREVEETAEGVLGYTRRGSRANTLWLG
jgi:hypothetical protein